MDLKEPRIEKKRKRVAACDACKKKHSKCDGDPCTRCVKKNFECTFSQKVKLEMKERMKNMETQIMSLTQETKKLRSELSQLLAVQNSVGTPEKSFSPLAGRVVVSHFYDFLPLIKKYQHIAPGQLFFNENLQNIVEKSDTANTALKYALIAASSALQLSANSEGIRFANMATELIHQDDSTDATIATAHMCLGSYKGYSGKLQESERHFMLAQQGFKEAIRKSSQATERRFYQEKLTFCAVCQIFTEGGRAAYPMIDQIASDSEEFVYIQLLPVLIKLTKFWEMVTEGEQFSLQEAIATLDHIQSNISLVLQCNLHLLLLALRAAAYYAAGDSIIALILCEELQNKMTENGAETFLSEVSIYSILAQIHKEEGFKDSFMQDISQLQFIQKYYDTREIIQYLMNPLGLARFDKTGPVWHYLGLKKPTYQFLPDAILL